jgi:plasmid stabilization system protein ParE
MADKKLRWDKMALQQFNKAIEYISKDSIQNAEKVRIDILEKVENLQAHPERYAPDKYKLDNDGSYKAFELYHLRIVYHVSSEEIRILRLRSTFQEPLNY